MSLSAANPVPAAVPRTPIVQSRIRPVVPGSPVRGAGAHRCPGEASIRYSGLLKRQNKVSRAATPGLDLSYGQVLEALNVEARAAIDSERLLAHLMGWPDAGQPPGVRQPEPPGPALERRADADPPAGRRDVPRVGEVLPVPWAVVVREVKETLSVQSTVHRGRMIDVVA